MADASHAVFLSYASQDAEAAHRISEALRSADIEVWFDQSALRGGDVWDQTIRKQIKSCALFVPVISKHTHERAEGYFRLEWKLAVDRCHLMAADKAFLVPVVIDDTPDDDERVPEKFREVQWTRLREGDTRSEFVTLIRHLLSEESGQSLTLARTSTVALPGRLSRFKVAWLAVPVVFAALAAYLLAEKPWTVKPAPTSKPPTSPDAPLAFNPPPHSIAVLPFVNLSGDPAQEYFSDGISEELINALSHIHTLQVAARTSSFGFRGKDVDVGAIARKLNVAAVLEGSIRRSGNTIRVTAQLINATNGFHVWSEDYDRDLKDVLMLQSDIATTVAQQLRASLVGDEVGKIVGGGTKNPDAYDAYLRATQLAYLSGDEATARTALIETDKAIRLDPLYAAAYARRATILRSLGILLKERGLAPSLLEQSRQSAERAITLDPMLADGHSALAAVYLDNMNFPAALTEMNRALALEPGTASVQNRSGVLQSALGNHEAAIAAATRAVELDPQNYRYVVNLAVALYFAHRFSDALQTARGAAALNPRATQPQEVIVQSYLGLGRAAEARDTCEAMSTQLGEDDRHACLALAYRALGLTMKANAEFQQLQRLVGSDEPYLLAAIYAQWGDSRAALRWLETAARQHDAELQNLKNEWMLDPIRNFPEFKELERRLNFPP